MYGKLSLIATFSLIVFGTLLFLDINVPMFIFVGWLIYICFFILYTFYIIVRGLVKIGLKKTLFKLGAFMGIIILFSCGSFVINLIINPSRNNELGFLSGFGIALILVFGDFLFGSEKQDD